jgi:amidophosphoribosyltransferase
MPTKEELIGSNKSIEQIRKHLGADSLGYLSVDGMLSTSSLTSKDNFCTACFTGKYPTPIEKNTGKLVLEKR